MNGFHLIKFSDESLLEVFDPGKYTSNHPAWAAAPATTIELPALTSDVAATTGGNSEFAEIARQEIGDFRELVRSSAEEETVSLAISAHAALADPGKWVGGREDAIRYLALNSSALLEDLWAEGDALWVKASSRRIHFENMAARRKVEPLAAASARPAFEEKDFTCYSDG